MLTYLGCCLAMIVGRQVKARRLKRRQESQAAAPQQ
jgi:hypothetical protein